MQGTISKFFPERYFGFVERDDGRPRAFFHGSQMRGGAEPVIGARVEFSLEPDPTGRADRAIDVRLVTPLEVDDDDDGYEVVS